MNSVEIKCPTRGQYIATGFEMSEPEFAKATLENYTIGCSLCGKTHVWSKRDAFLVEKTPQQASS